MAYELSLASAELTVLESGWVAVVGATAKVVVAGQEGESNAVWPVQSRDRIMINPPTGGARVYVQWGPAGRAGRLASVPRSSEILVTPGPDLTLQDWPLPPMVRISRTLNRVGVRCEPVAALRHNLEVSSRPHVTGSVQVTPAGELIFIGPDGPVTGGYPQPWVVARACLSILGQAAPGAEIEVKLITREEARKRWHDHELGVSKRLQELRLGAGVHRE
jgi:allophanate hydrolase subunit 2